MPGDTCQDISSPEVKKTSVDSAKLQGGTGTGYQEDGMHLKHLWELVRKSVRAWVDDYASSMGAALAYYTLFSIAPLLIITIAVAGLVFGQQPVEKSSHRYKASSDGMAQTQCRAC